MMHETAMQLLSYIFSPLLLPRGNKLMRFDDYATTQLYEYASSATMGLLKNVKSLCPFMLQRIYII